MGHSAYAATLAAVYSLWQCRTVRRGRLPHSPPSLSFNPNTWFTAAHSAVSWSGVPPLPQASPTAPV